MKNIRNFSIIAHIDHGKSTLADRLLQKTGVVDSRNFHDQFLDNIDVERERGITIKLQTIRMDYQHNDEDYVLNLIDTPGHIDFSYEVSRAMQACEGALLLVDAAQGIEAQTLANYTKAHEEGLRIIPVVNKIDLPAAEPESVALDLVETFGFDQDDIQFISAKTGEGIDELLDAIIRLIPAPTSENDTHTQALIFDSYFDSHKGVVALIRTENGTIHKGTKLHIKNSKTDFLPIDIGYISSTFISGKEIETGSVGYIATGLKDIGLVGVGDTITTAEEKNEAEALPGYMEPKPMVFANVFPEDADQYKDLREAVEKYNLTDAAFTYDPINSPAYGSGFRCGFLGLLHIEVVQERIRGEYNVETTLTTPNVLYFVTLSNGTRIPVQAPDELPDPSQIKLIEEPWCSVSIYSPQDYVGNVMKVAEHHRSVFNTMRHVGTDTHQRVEMSYHVPLSEVISNFNDNLKSATSGYASMDYEIADYKEIDLVKLDILLNHETHDVLSRLVVRQNAAEIGEQIVNKLKELLPRQQFKLPIQAAIGGNIVARADVAAVRKDVLAKLYGGDRTRKDKLLKKQAAGKKRLASEGRVSIPSDVYAKLAKI